MHNRLFAIECDKWHFAISFPYLEIAYGAVALAAQLLQGEIQVTVAGMQVVHVPTVVHVVMRVGEMNTVQ